MNSRIPATAIALAVVATVLAASLAAAGGAFAATRTIETSARVDVTVWQRIADGNLYLSTRPAGGSWTTHNQALDMSRLSASGRFRQGSAITVDVPVSVTAEGRAVEASARVDVTVWQRITDGNLYLSTRPAGGRWTTHNEALDMSRLSASGRFRQGSAITVAVPVSVIVDVTPLPTITPEVEDTFWSWQHFYFTDYGYFPETGEKAFYVHGRYRDSNLVEPPYVVVWCAGFYAHSFGIPLGDGTIEVTYRLGHQPESSARTETWTRRDVTDTFGEAGQAHPSSDAAQVGMVRWLYENYVHGDTFHITVGDAYRATFNFTGLSRVFQELGCFVPRITAGE